MFIIDETTEYVSVDHPPTGADTNIDIYWNNICNIQTTLVINLANYAILTLHQARIDSR